MLLWLHITNRQFCHPNTFKQKKTVTAAKQATVSNYASNQQCVVHQLSTVQHGTACLAAVLTSSIGSFVLYRMLTACNILLMKDCGAVQRGVSRMYSTTVGKLLANSSGGVQEAAGCRQTQQVCQEMTYQGTCTKYHLFCSGACPGCTAPLLGSYWQTALEVYKTCKRQGNSHCRQSVRKRHTTGNHWKVASAASTLAVQTLRAKACTMPAQCCTPAANIPCSPVADPPFAPQRDGV